MIAAYYRERGWDGEGHVPGQERGVWGLMGGLLERCRVFRRGIRGARLDPRTEPAPTSSGPQALGSDAGRWSVCQLGERTSRPACRLSPRRR